MQCGQLLQTRAGTLMQSRQVSTPEFNSWQMEAASRYPIKQFSTLEDAYGKRTEPDGRGASQAWGALSKYSKPSGDPLQRRNILHGKYARTRASTKTRAAKWLLDHWLVRPSYVECELDQPATRTRHAGMSPLEFFSITCFGAGPMLTAATAWRSDLPSTVIFQS